MSATPLYARRAMVVGMVVLTMTAACTSNDTSGGDTTPDAAATSSPVAGAASSGAGSSGAGSTNTITATTATAATKGKDLSDAELWDASLVHEISVRFEQADYDAMLATFRSSGDKDWIDATITIDGERYETVGMRLKGNSTLRGLAGGGGGFGGPPGGGPGGGGGPASSVSAEDPQSLPWLIRLDKFVDGQDHRGTTDIVVRANNSKTSLNEAVALELIGLADLATQKAIATRFAVNDLPSVLRLTIENPDDSWDEENFDDDGILYKAEAQGSWNYRGTDAAAYADSFEQETDAKNDNLTPLIEFLDFVNNSSDTSFAADLDEHLDVDAFARYLAAQELIDNFDDIDGPGNNAYLRYSKSTKRFTVVNWDLNLAFGALGGGAPGGFPGGGPPPGAGVPRGGGFPGNRANPLVDRFEANAKFNALVQKAIIDLRSEFYGSGAARKILDTWTATLQTHASDLVTPEVVQQESAALAAKFIA